MSAWGYPPAVSFSSCQSLPCLFIKEKYAALLQTDLNFFADGQRIFTADIAAHLLSTELQYRKFIFIDGIPGKYLNFECFFFSRHDHAFCTNGKHRLCAILNRITGKGKTGSLTSSEAVNDLTEACRRMAEDKTGALIVIVHKNPLEEIISTGDRIDAAIHRRLIMNLFFKNSPLHDGAVIIDNHHIVAARCTLPITERTDIPAKYGMRHKAAIGITEETDADVIVVSEETGGIAFGHGGTLTEINNINELKLKLGASLSSGQEEKQ